MEAWTFDDSADTLQGLMATIEGVTESHAVMYREIHMPLKIT